DSHRRECEVMAGIETEHNKHAPLRGCAQEASALNIELCKRNIALQRGEVVLEDICLGINRSSMAARAHISRTEIALRVIALRGTRSDFFRLALPWPLSTM